MILFGCFFFIGGALGGALFGGVRSTESWWPSQMSLEQVLIFPHREHRRLWPQLGVATQLLVDRRAVSTKPHNLVREKRPFAISATVPIVRLWQEDEQRKPAGLIFSDRGQLCWWGKSDFCARWWLAGERQLTTIQWKCNQKVDYTEWVISLSEEEAIVDMGEPKLMRFAQIRPLGSVLGTSFRSPPSQSSENFRGHEKAGEDRGDNWYLSRLEFFHNTFLLTYLPTGCPRKSLL